ncbi:MAG TPA: glycoside hydrolase family 5 protein [Dokdonella sp.]
MRASVSLVLLAALAASTAAQANDSFGGVNLSGAEFGSGALPGEVGVDYVWPTAQEVDYFHGRGMNVLRVPFLWERMQPSPGAPLDADYLAGLDAVVACASALGMRVILDPHDYARYYGEPIGSDDVPDSVFADFWSRLAAHYAANEHVVFGLMNEPHDLPTEQWADAANAAIAAIRAGGADQLILVPGNGWTTAATWSDDWYGTPNAIAMLAITDSGDHFAFELHQYFDADYSGTSPVCQAAPGTGPDQLEDVTGWLRANGFKGFLAELAGADNADCEAAVENALDYLRDNADAWLGWTWWAAGPWWGDYMFTLEPSEDFTVDAPQMAWLAPYLPPIFADGFDG